MSIEIPPTSSATSTRALAATPLSGMTMSPASDHLTTETNQLTVDTLMEVAQLKPTQRRQAILAVEILSAKTPPYPNPDLDQVQVAGIAKPQQQPVTDVVRRLLAAQRILGGHGTIMLIRCNSADEANSESDTVDAIAFSGDIPGGLKRILLYSLDSMSWRITHLSVYVLPRLHSHFVHGIRFETPALRYPLLPLTEAFDANTRMRVAKKWTSDKLGDRLLAIQKLGQLMPALYFDVVDKFLRGTAVGTVDKTYHFAITIPAVGFDQKALVHLPFLRERQYYR